MQHFFIDDDIGVLAIFSKMFFFLNRFRLLHIDE